MAKLVEEMKEFKNPFVCVDGKIVQKNKHKMAEALSLQHQAIVKQYANASVQTNQKTVGKSL